MFKKSVAFLSLAVAMLFLLPAAILLYCFVTSPSTAVIFGCGIIVGFFLKRNKKIVQEQLKEVAAPLPVVDSKNDSDLPGSSDEDEDEDDNNDDEEDEDDEDESEED